MPDDRLPLFPLGLVLLPGEPVPLHIFEPRYKEMVRVCIDGDRPFGIVYASESKLAGVGTTARIERVVQRYEDGRLDIVAVGQERFDIVEIHRDLSFLSADIRPIDDEPGDDEAARQSAIARHLKLLEMAGEEPVLQRYESEVPGSFVIGQNAGLDLDDKQALLELTAEAERIRTLSEHLGSLLVRLEKSRAFRDRARGDGHAEGFPDLGDLS